MILDLPHLTEEIRCRSFCEICGKTRRFIEVSFDCCHALTRGAGHVDARFNLVAGHRLCHSRIDSEPGGSEKLLTIACRREGCKVEDAREAIFAIRRLPKRASPERIEAELRRLRPAVRRLVTEALAEIPK